MSDSLNILSYIKNKVDKRDMMMVHALNCLSALHCMSTRGHHFFIYLVHTNIMHWFPEAFVIPYKQSFSQEM